jgi:hypothetical protein
MAAAAALAARGGGGDGGGDGCRWQRIGPRLAAVLHDAGASAGAAGGGGTSKATTTAALNLDGKRGSKDLDRGRE